MPLFPSTRLYIFVPFLVPEPKSPPASPPRLFRDAGILFLTISVQGQGDKIPPADSAGRYTFHVYGDVSNLCLLRSMLYPAFRAFRP